MRDNVRCMIGCVGNCWLSTGTIKLVRQLEWLFEDARGLGFREYMFQLQIDDAHGCEELARRFDSPHAKTVRTSGNIGLLDDKMLDQCQRRCQ